MMVDFGEPFLADVLERGGGGHAEAHEENVGLGVGERTEAIVIFLTGGIEETEGVGFVANPRSAVWLSTVVSEVAAQNYTLGRGEVKLQGGVSWPVRWGKAEHRARESDDGGL